MKNIAIYGFGRIGRLATRAAISRRLFAPSCIADVKDPDVFMSLFRYDSNQGTWAESTAFENGEFIIGSTHIRYYDSAHGIPPWRDLDIDIVVDCSALSTTRAGAERHISAGARKVLVSAASKTMADCDAVLLPGINLDEYEPRRHNIISMASCTTNALAPVVKVLLDHFGIARGFFSTVHSYTSTQSLTDQPMESRRDSWAASENIIPTTSGAAKALKFIWPDLNVTGKSYRVPTRTGSIVELIAELGTKADAEKIKNAFRSESEKSSLNGIMGILEEEYASSRVIGESHSSLVDLPLVDILDGRLLSIAAWYDNEMGYAHRLAETAAFIAGDNPHGE